MIARYYALCKPGMVYGNVFTTIAGALFGIFYFDLTLYDSLSPLIGSIVGIALVIASACVYNNITDRKIDGVMERTKERALVTGKVSVVSARIFGAMLGIFGFYILYTFANSLTAYLSFFGWIAYVVLYALAKRGTYLGALVGSLSGAVPIVVGYTGITGQIDVVALVLFIILALWQMPHFYAIALYRMEDYKKAGIPVLPILKGIRSTKNDIVIYTSLYIFSTVVLYIVASLGTIYLLGVLLSGLWWLHRAISGYASTGDVLWAKALFRLSLVVLVIFSVSLAFSPLLP